MPYIVTSETTASEAAQAAFDVAMPAGHQVDDVLVAIVGQDGGGTTIVASGWTQIGTQAANQAQRTTAFWKLATNSSMADLTLTGATDEWVATIVVIRGANTSSPINVEARVNSANSSAAFLDSGTVTTTENGALIIYAWGFDGGVFLTLPMRFPLVGKASNASAYCQIVSALNKPAAGETENVRALADRTTEGGQALVIAVRDANPSAPLLSYNIAETHNVLAYYGDSATQGFGKFSENTVYEAFDALAATSIAGIPLSDVLGTPSQTLNVNSPWGNFTSSTSLTATAGVGVWHGLSHALAATDFTGKVFSIEFTLNNYTLARVGAMTFIAVFEDSAGNWKAFLLNTRSGSSIALTYRGFVAPGSTALDSSGTLDWEDIVRIGYAYNRTSTTTGSSAILIKTALLTERTTVTGGCVPAPITPGLLDNISNGWTAMQVAGLQGRGQMLHKTSLQLGDGTTPTYVDFSATSYELPVAPTASIKTRFWQIPTDTVEFRIKASAADTINLNSCVIVTDTRQKFVIDAASSPDANYSFAGASFIGWAVENNVAGVEIRDATFKLCHGITLNGGKLASVVTESIADPAVITNNPGNILDCDFITDGSGHAIEITLPGTYTFQGNHFFDYGADGTADAAIHNTSGGLVTLNITGGGDTPTVKNGAGASTIINNTVVLTVSNLLSGSDVVIYDADVASTGDGSNCFADVR